MGLSGVMLTTDKMDQKTVYNILKIAAANTKTLGSVHKIYKAWTPSLQRKLVIFRSIRVPKNSTKKWGAIN